MSEHHHDEGVPHRHPLRPDQDDTLTYWRAMEIAVRELLIEKQITTADEVRAEVEAMDSRSPSDGARVVAKAWTDPEFRKLLFEDANEACASLGLERGLYKLVALENSDKVHNVVVCTLCSCYPRFLLGLPPDWYKSRNYRSRMVNSPREVLREFGTEIADDVVVRVHDSNADMRYLVIPERPEGTEGWSEAQLAQLISRDAMIGVTVARNP